jgi:hypothetical protein
VRAILAASVFALAFVASATAQEQERKLIDRILKPDMSLQNSVQEKQFVARGATATRQAPTKEFYVRERKPEKSFFTRVFGTKNFNARNSRYQNMQASLATRTRIAKADVPYSTAAYRDVEPAREAEKAVEVSEFSGSRPFLIQGKSQKALSQKDTPLTIEQVRELLNKNK